MPSILARPTLWLGLPFLVLVSGSCKVISKSPSVNELIWQQKLSIETDIALQESSFEIVKEAVHDYVKDCSFRLYGGLYQFELDDGKITIVSAASQPESNDILHNFEGRQVLVQERATTSPVSGAFKADSERVVHDDPKKKVTIQPMVKFPSESKIMLEIVCIIHTK